MALKVFKFHGKTEDEIKSLSEEEFLQLIPSRQRRTIKRGYTKSQKAVIDKLKAGKDNIETHARDMVVTPMMIGKTIKIHNGKEFVSIIIQPQHLGLYFGEMVLTRKKANHSKSGVPTKKKVTVRK